MTLTSFNQRCMRHSLSDFHPAPTRKALAVGKSTLCSAIVSAAIDKAEIGGIACTEAQWKPQRARRRSGETVDHTGWTTASCVRAWGGCFTFARRGSPVLQSKMPHTYPNTSIDV
jgi:hypothetical protein